MKVLRALIFITLTFQLQTGFSAGMLTAPTGDQTASILYFEQLLQSGAITREQLVDTIRNLGAQGLISPAEVDQAIEHFKAQAKIHTDKQNQKNKELSIQEARNKVSIIQERDQKLPGNIRKDKYMVALTDHLKQENYIQSITYFELLNNLNTNLSPSFNYFWGEALLNIGEPDNALNKLYAYIEQEGSSGKYYSQALQLINRAEADQTN